ncbi:MAG: hypothetical protein RLO52_35575 [Sandaracinaceae bacterium]
MRALVWLIAALGGTVASGCVRHYQEPAVSEPHAVVRIRTIRHRWAGPMLDETVRLNAYAITMPPAGPGPTTHALRVRPEPAMWRFGTDFYHLEQRSRLETYQESYSCGTSSYPQTCTRTQTRTAYYTAHVTDAACQGVVQHEPLAGAAYLLQYEFYDHGHCTASCFRQLSSPSGEFQLIPCGPNEPPAYATPASMALPRAPHAAPRTSGGENAGGARPRNTLSPP